MGSNITSFNHLSPAQRRKIALMGVQKKRENNSFAKLGSERAREMLKRRREVERLRAQQLAIERKDEEQQDLEWRKRGGNI